jgi:hypothetical protein
MNFEELKEWLDIQNFTNDDIKENKFKIKLALLQTKTKEFIDNLDINKKEALLDLLYELSKSEPEQKSQEWVNRRIYTIGGSEIAKVIGKSKYGNVYDFIKDKAFPGGFMGNLYTKFGSYFEIITKKLMEELFTTNIYELPSLPGGLEFTSYSPDGVSIVLAIGMAILWEFKAPFSRIPNNQIPDEYIPQVKLGLQTIKWCDGAMFVNILYRICNIDDFINQNLGYNKTIHYLDDRKDILYKPKQIIANGMFIMTQSSYQLLKLFEKIKERNKYREDLEELHDVHDLLNEDVTFTKHLTENENIFLCHYDDNYNILLNEVLKKIIEYDSIKTNKQEIYESILKMLKDCGSIDKNVLENIFSWAEEDLITLHPISSILVENVSHIRYFEDATVNFEVNIQTKFMETLKQIIESKEIISGIIPWKCFDIDLHFIPNNDPEYFTPHLNQINKIGNIMVELANKNETEKWNILEKHFAEKVKKDRTILRRIYLEKQKFESVVSQDDLMF